MPRFNNINGKRVQFTEQEEAIRNSEELAWANGKAKRDAQEEIALLESQVTNRRIRDLTTDTGKLWMETQEALISIQRSIMVG